MIINMVYGGDVYINNITIFDVYSIEIIDNQINIMDIAGWDICVINNYKEIEELEYVKYDENQNTQHESSKILIKKGELII